MSDADLRRARPRAARLRADRAAPGRTRPSSFSDFLAAQAPDLLPSRRSLPQGHAGDLAPHGTTIVSATFPGGVVMAGDRRATMGNIIAQRDIEKVFPADEFSAVGIAGTAGLAVEMVRLFQTELEHYEKIEGSTLSMDGKANRLAALIRANLGMAMQGLAVVPLFAGYDLHHEPGPDLQLRRHRRPLRGDRVPLGRLRARCSPAGRSRSSTARTSPPSRPSRP